jgi:hypothetical protein
MSGTIVTLPDIDSVLGIALRGKELEFQYQSGALVVFPKPEDTSPDACYSVRLSVKSARRLVELLSAGIAQASKAP